MCSVLKSVKKLQQIGVQSQFSVDMNFLQIFPMSVRMPPWQRLSQKHVGKLYLLYQVFVAFLDNEFAGKDSA